MRRGIAAYWALKSDRGLEKLKRLPLNLDRTRGATANNG